MPDHVCLAMVHVSHDSDACEYVGEGAQASENADDEFRVAGDERCCHQRDCE